MDSYEKLYKKACERLLRVTDVLRMNAYFTGPDPEHITIRIPFSDKKGVITAISISAVKLIEWSDPYTKVLEIALIGVDGKCTYISDLGYDDVCCFDDVDQVMEEIDRLKSLR
jgi:hypothetical protein